MEETKELQTVYKIFRTLIYVSLVVEFFEYAIDPELLDYWGGIVCDVHDRMKRWFKLTTILCIFVTCIGTRNKKHIEFDARRQVLYPLVGGFFVTLVSIWLFKTRMDTRFYTIALNIWLYMAASILGTILIHVALDNISKFLKEGLLKDRFNFENESFQQCEELIENKYSVNIPMRYYYKSKFRKGPSPSLSHLSDSIVPRALLWLSMTTSFRHWPPNSTITTARTSPLAKYPRDASSISSTSWMWNTADVSILSS